VKNSSPYRDSNSDLSVVQPVAKSLFESGQHLGIKLSWAVMTFVRDHETPVFRHTQGTVMLCRSSQSVAKIFFGTEVSPYMLTTLSRYTGIAVAFSV
jgi:hypothetical protein